MSNITSRKLVFTDLRDGFNRVAVVTEIQNIVTHEWLPIAVELIGQAGGHKSYALGPDYYNNATQAHVPYGTDNAHEYDADELEKFRQTQLRAAEAEDAANTPSDEILF